MIEWQIVLNPDTDNLEIEEPGGLQDLELSIVRDEKFHGIGFEASTSDLQFYGDAYDFLKQQKETYGINANVIFRASSRCGEQEEFEEVISGKLNFGRYKETCGEICSVSLPIEQVGCQQLFKNRFSHNVDIDNMKAFDEATVLPQYGGLGIGTEITPVELAVADTADAGDTYSENLAAQPDWFKNVNPDMMRAHLFPAFANVTESSFGSFNTASYPTLYNGGANNRPNYLSLPVLVNTSSAGGYNCFISDAELTFRLKGSVQQTLSGAEAFTSLRTKVFRLKFGLDPAVLDNWEMLYDEQLASLSNNDTEVFDQSDTVSLAGTQQGDLIYFSVFVLVNRIFDIDTFVFNEDPESNIHLSAGTVCESSTADLSLVHETLSRVTESITNYCLRVKSSYYGRTDSEPFHFENDGCGSLRALTSGLKLRKAEEDKFFVSAEKLLNGLRCIDNIGFDIVADETRLSNGYVLRVEDISFFYRDVQVLSCAGIKTVQSTVEEDRHYSKILAGYDKWEVREVNGLDEIHADREFRTSIESVSNELNIKCNLVAGSYAIELTRLQSFDTTGGADTDYDNETFIMCMERSAYNFIIEQGGLLPYSENIFNEASLYNYRISPIRNLMRWFRSIINSYPNLNGRIYFSSGEANFIGKGMLADDFCRQEIVPVAENQDIFVTLFEDAAMYTPLWKNDTASFEHNLSVSEYNKLKENPYGYISYQCGNGDFDKGYIKEIKFKPVIGKARFILRKKWQ